MNRTQHISNTAVLGAPEGWDQKELPCGALPITRSELNGVPMIISFWTPTSDELLELNSGGVLALWVAGESMPMVALTIEHK
jgi:hypothetical protein